MKIKRIQFVRNFSIGLSALCVVSTAYAAYPLWTFTPDPNFPPRISIKPNKTATVVYEVQNQSYKAKSLVMKPIPGVVQSLPCQMNPIGQQGSSCSLVLNVTGNALPKEGVHTGPILCESNSNGTPNANQCYRPSAADNLNITRLNSAIITVDPFILLIAQPLSGTGIGVVTVTNDINSSEPAYNIVANIPGGTAFSVQSTTCGSILAIGYSCDITFASSAADGPTTIPVQGDNTNTANVYVESASTTLISITSPTQQNRIVPSEIGSLSLTVTNDPDSLQSATNIDVIDKSSCPNLSVDASNCTSLAVGASCDLLLFRSLLTPSLLYAPCTITISGTNTANSPTTLIAFSRDGGLIFETNGITGKIVSNQADEFTSEWTFPGRSDVPGATSMDDGKVNTDNIVANPDCIIGTSNCAAYRCTEIGSGWYLPAATQLQSVIFTLCPGSSYPCAFGDFSNKFYWSSTQWYLQTRNAYAVDVPDGNFGLSDKWSSQPVRCIRDF